MSVDLTLWEVWPIKAFIGAINKISTEPKAWNGRNSSAESWWGVLINTVSQPDAEVSSSQSWKANPDVDTNRESNEPRERREEKTTGLSNAAWNSAHDRWTAKGSHWPTIRKNTKKTKAQQRQRTWEMFD